MVRRIRNLLQDQTGREIKNQSLIPPFEDKTGGETKEPVFNPGS